MSGLTTNPTRPGFSDTCCSRLRRFMSAGGWFPSSALERVGGRRFAARLHEIERGQDGRPPRRYEVELRAGGRSWYRLLPVDAKWTPPAPRRERAKERITELLLEVERLKAELAEVRARRPA